MRDGARVAAAIQVLDDVEQRRKPVRVALKTWGEASRYAGAKDRAWVSGLVLDALRRRRSLAWMIGGEDARAAVLGVLGFVWGWPAERIAAAVGDEPHGPGALTECETAALSSPRALDDAPSPVRGDYPDWLDEFVARQYGDARVHEVSALASRAPVDLRVNSLKTDVARALKALSALGAVSTGVLADALRVPAPYATERAAPVESAPEFQKGWFEVQDLGSQIAAAAAGDVKGKQVLDFCAGGGGKTLALAAAMANSGQLYAYDSDPRRLSETVKRCARAGVRNLQIRSPIRPDALQDLEGRMDVVFVDAPCSGSGTWRRHPDAKWRLTPEQLARRMTEQDAVLAAAAAYVNPRGRLIYVTCSLLREENEDRLAAFLCSRPGFAAASVLAQIGASGAAAEASLAALARVESGGFLRLTPRNFGVDGFFVAVLERVP